MLVERIDRARQPAPLATIQRRRGQAFGIDLDHLLRRKPRQEAGAEMPTRLDHDGRRLGNIEAEHLEEHRVSGLDPIGYYDDDDPLRAADAQCGRSTQNQGAALGVSEPTHDRAIVQSDDLDVGREWKVAR